MANEWLMEVPPEVLAAIRKCCDDLESWLYDEEQFIGMTPPIDTVRQWLEQQTKSQDSPSSR